MKLAENLKDWAGELTQCLRSPAAFPEDTGFKPSIHMVAYKQQ